MGFKNILAKPLTNIDITILVVIIALTVAVVMGAIDQERYFTLMKYIVMFIIGNKSAIVARRLKSGL